MPRICQPINVLKLTNVSIVRYKVGANTFELACYPNKVRDWRDGKEPDISEVLQSDRIFTCVNKGQFARDAELMGAFGTTNFSECVKKILVNGEVPLAAQERKLLQRNFLAEVYTIALAKLKPVEKGLFLHIDTLKQMTQDARVVPKMKRNLPPKACAALLVQNLVRAYPTQFGMSASDIQLDFPDVAVAKKCYTEILKPSAAFGIRQVQSEKELAGVDPTIAAATSVSLQVYVGEDLESDLKTYCEANNIKYRVLRNVKMISPKEISEKSALPAYLQTSTNAATTKKPEGAEHEVSLVSKDIGARDSASSSLSSSEAGPETDLFLTSSNKPKESLYDMLVETESIGSGTPAVLSAQEDGGSDSEPDKAAKFLLKGRREIHEEVRLREKKIRSKERKGRELEKLEKVSEAANRKRESENPIPPPSAPTEDNLKSPNWCAACQVDFAEYLKQNIRQHTKMEWHVFNQKRHLRGQAPVTRQMFEELSRDIREGYLAVEN